MFSSLKLKETKRSNMKGEDKGLKTPINSNHQKPHSKHDEDVEVDSIATCRICFECNGDDDKDLISPCLCKGTQQLVHRSCLDNWRSVKEGFAFSHCTTCKAQFHLRVVDLERKNNIKFRLFLARYIIRVFLAIQVVIGIIGGVASLADRKGSFRNLFDDQWARFLSKHPIPFYYCVGVVFFLLLVGVIGTILYFCGLDPRTGRTTGCICPCDGEACGGSPEAGVLVLVFLVVIIMVIGTTYALFALTVIFQNIWQRHNLILVKRELTEEFVVEDLNGCYTPAQLNTEHMERLKALNLF